MSVFSEAFEAIDSSDSQTRKFGFLLAGVAAIVFAIFYWRTAEWTLWLAAVGLGVLLVAVFFPRALKQVYTGWMALAIVLGFVSTHIILTIVYYLVITPIGLIMRVFAKDPLNRKINRSAGTYWIPKIKEPYSRGRAEKLF